MRASRESIAATEDARDLDQPYERIAQDRPTRRTPTTAELEARLRTDPSTSPQALSWLDHMDALRREKRAE